MIQIHRTPDGAWRIDGLTDEQMVAIAFDKIYTAPWYELQDAVNAALDRDRPPSPYDAS